MSEPEDITTPTGVIHYGGPCRDDYDNIEVYDQPPEGGSPIKLQKAALEAFRGAERAYGVATDRPSGERRIQLTGSWRSCSYQRELFAKDPARYADPDVTGHTRGIAIDVSTAVPNPELIARCLRENGWTRTRPDDEPWHWSYGVTV
ncbi:MAG: hypothetical protein ACRDHU_00170 [Actinomycetota bacterium]